MDPSEFIRDQFADRLVVVDADNGVVRLKQGGNPATPITNEYAVVQDLTFHNYDFSGRPAIQVSGTLYNAFTSTTIDINTTILTR